MKADDKEIELRAVHEQLVKNGLLDADQSTEYSHYLHDKKMRSEFTPLERQLIRHSLGLDNQSQRG